MTSLTVSKPGFATVPAQDLDRLFAPRPFGYAGADVGLAITLPDGRILWIFGDTLVGSCETGNRSWYAMPRNTVAIQPAASRNPAAIEWHYTDRSGKPAAFFQLPENEAGEWFWPGTGVIIDDQLLVFGFGVVDCDSECEALAFRVVRGWMFRVANTAGDPSGWKYNASPVEWKSPFIFSSACFLEDEHLYCVGIEMRERDTGQSSAYLARIDARKLSAEVAAATPYFWSKGEQWSSDPSTELLALYHPGVTECSIYHDAPRNRYLATTYTGHAPELLVTSAPSLTGPWSAPVPIYTCSESPANDFLYYTFRMHPHLAATPDEMIMSYVVNARRPSELKTNTEIYFPRFIRVDLREM